ncbi:Hypothetical protein SMAX5B_003492 [Scophthalmus maximus]|uniref:Uncharacterized protein n=1 Tax=Scophthalmus maximus TaxID=52904 RepID=A0A2U9CLX8_SCOMX|nr:Hypothetical protein SMAX5B_003492 [Scophthalmus maximus]
MDGGFGGFRCRVIRIIKELQQNHPVHPPTHELRHCDQRKRVDNGKNTEVRTKETSMVA